MKRVLSAAAALTLTLSLGASALAYYIELLPDRKVFQYHRYLMALLPFSQ